MAYQMFELVNGEVKNYCGEREFKEDAISVVTKLHNDWKFHGQERHYLIAYNGIDVFTTAQPIKS